MKEKIRTNKIILIASVFCIPSFLFWCSGMHKDGFIFMAVALIVFYFNKWIEEKKISLSAVIVWLVCIVLLFTLRNFVLFLLLPALLTWYLCTLCPKRKWIVISSVYGSALVIFFIARFVNSSLDFPAYIVSKQNEFKALAGNSQLTLPLLEPTFLSFIKFFPVAADIAFLRPHITETTNMAYWPAITENIFLYTLILYAVLSSIISKNNNRRLPVLTQPIIIFCYCFAISNLLLSGYTVTLTGAIVRYRSFVLPFLITPLANFIHINKKNHS